MGIRPPRPCGCVVDADAACPHYVVADPPPPVPIVRIGDRVTIGEDGRARVITTRLHPATAGAEWSRASRRRSHCPTYSDGGLSNAMRRPEAPLNAEALLASCRELAATRALLDEQEATIRRQVLEVLRAGFKKEKPAPTVAELERGTIVRLRDGAPPMHARGDKIDELFAVLLTRAPGDSFYFVPEEFGRRPS